MGPETLALLQHTHVFLPREEGVGAPGCHGHKSGHRLSTDPEDLDLTSFLSCLMLERRLELVYNLSATFFSHLCY